MKITAERKSEKDILLTIRDNYDIVIQITYDHLREEVNKAIEGLYPKIK